MKQVFISIMIPCYKSERYIGRTAEEILRVCAGHPEYRYELILVNDGSGDGTYEEIRKICARDPHVIGADLERNVGQARAKMAALALARGEIGVFMDDDGQHAAEDLLELVREVRDGADLAYAQFGERKESGMRRAASAAVNLALAVMIRKPRKLKISSFFALSPRAMRALKGYRSRYPFIGGWILSKRGSAVGVPLEERERAVGGSTYSMRKLVRRAFEMTLLFRIPLPEGEAMYAIREVTSGDLQDDSEAFLK